MTYLIILPLIAWVISALVIGIELRRRGRPTSKKDLVKLGIVSGGFIALGLIAAIHLVLNGDLA